MAVAAGEVASFIRVLLQIVELLGGDRRGVPLVDILFAATMYHKGLVHDRTQGLEVGDVLVALSPNASARPVHYTVGPFSENLAPPDCVRAPGKLCRKAPPLSHWIRIGPVESQKIQDGRREVEIAQ